MNFSLRPAKNEDAPAVRDLVRAVLEEYGLEFDPAGTDSDLIDLESSYHLSGGTIDLLVDDANNVLGSVGLVPQSLSTCELRKMYLARAVRGRGWGRRLLEHALAHASTLGFERVVLETSTRLREAIALYESRGFRPYMPEHLATRCNAAYVLEISSKPLTG